MNRKNQGHGGFTLLEVLLAMVILCVGLLGLAAMQMVGMRSNSTSTYLSQATVIGSDITERIRANRSAMAAGAFANYDSDAVACGVMPNPYCADYSAGGSTVPAVACTDAELATFDLNVIACGDRLGAARTPGSGIQNALPGGRIQVLCNNGGACTAPYNHVVTITWNDAAKGADGKTTQIARTLVIPVIP